MEVAMLTTSDNPYDPFTQFDEWYAFDERKGYHTCGYIERISRSSSELSPYDQIAIVNDAIDEILKFNVLGNYKKVVKQIE